MKIQCPHCGQHYEIDDNAVDYGEDDYAGIIPVIRKYMRPGDNDDVRRALEVVVLDRKASTSYLQRRLKIGYNRAAEIMDLFEERGIVGPFEGSKPRQLLITREQWQAIKDGAPTSSEPVEEEIP